jgi:hypothetical protein
MAGTAALARLLAGCERFVVLDPRVDPTLAPVTPIGDFYRYQCCGLPDLDPSTHVTTVSHEDEALAEIELAFLDGLASRELEHTLQCIGSSPIVQRIGNAVWRGLPLLEVLDALGVGVPASAVGLRIEAIDGYDAGLPLDDLAAIWLVWGMNGEPLPLDHGAPARLIVPGRYGVKNLKWLTDIAFVDTPHTSFWSLERNGGWSEEATYKPNALVAHPLSGAPVEPGPVRFVGTAFAGDDPVVSVEVSLDGGPWVDATLDYAPGPGVWVLWSVELSLDEGEHTVQVRCTTASGATSVPDPWGTDPKAGYDGSMLVTVYV